MILNLFNRNKDKSVEIPKNLHEKICAFISLGIYPIPPILRNIDIAKKSGYKVICLGAIRESNLKRKEVWNNIEIERLGIFYPNSSILYFIGIPLFSLYLSCWLIRKKPKIIHASNLESMIGVAIYKFLGGNSKIIFNIHDNFSLRYKVPTLLKDIMKFIEIFFGKFANVILIPDKERLKLLLPWKPKEVYIIPNITIDYGKYYPKKFDGNLKIFASGWLNWCRGFKVLGELVKLRDDIELIVCGSGVNNVEDFLKSLPRTKYYGYLNQDKALELGRNCDLIFAFYDPKTEINRYASSNKLYDALAIGRPILTNKGIKMAEWVEKNKVGFSLKYGDLQDFNELLDFILQNPELLVEMGEHAREIYETEYKWEKYERLLKNIFSVNRKRSS
jgi:glycosyltransferase involved in cell wall biosynthesis